MIPYDSLILVNFPILCSETLNKIWNRSQHVLALILVLQENLKNRKFHLNLGKINFYEKYGFYVLACNSTQSNDRIMIDTSFDCA